MNIDKLLEERGSRYGKFEQHARITQAMKEAMKVERSRICRKPIFKQDLSRLSLYYSP